MTRFAGYRKTLSQCCKSQYYEIAFASINFSSQEYWTDGHREASLAPTDGGLRRCRCGWFYLTSEASYLPGVQKNIGDADAQMAYVNDAILELAIQSNRFSTDCEIVIRRRLWRSSNSIYRKEYRKIKSIDSIEFPSYSPNLSTRSNLNALATLLKKCI